MCIYEDSRRSNDRTLQDTFQNILDGGQPPTPAEMLRVDPTTMEKIKSVFVKILQANPSDEDIELVWEKGRRISYEYMVNILWQPLSIYSFSLTYSRAYGIDAVKWAQLPKDERGEILDLLRKDRKQTFGMSDDEWQLLPREDRKKMVDQKREELRR